MDQQRIDPEMKYMSKLLECNNIDIGKVWWPQCFIDGQISATRSNRALCADALVAWGNCLARHKPPSNFGVAMLLIGVRLGCDDPTAENLLAISETFH